MSYAAATRNVVATGLAGMGRAAAHRSAYPCWFRVIGGIRVLAVLGLASSRPVASRIDRKQLEHGLTDCTETTRICSVGATEVAAFPTDWFLIEQHISDGPARCDGRWDADRLIRVDSV
ncbi:MAG: hypothetical protein P3C09_01265 [Gemmatimonadota bacterium]|nr:hypothetical protein [Gemmatimonadota bacterium]MDQ8166369.1 hypothetical protein [Gemmatimonadota bacterium]